MADFFKTEKGVDLEVLTTATLSKLEEIKEKTATGQWFTFYFFSKQLEKRGIAPSSRGFLPRGIWLLLAMHFSGHKAQM